MSQNKIEENKICSLLGLIHIDDVNGFDGIDEFGNSYEIKTFKEGLTSITTAHHITFHRLNKMRMSYWIIAEVSRKDVDGAVHMEIHNLWISHPSGLEETFSSIEKVLNDGKKFTDEIEHICKFSGEKKKRLNYILDRAIRPDNIHIPLKLFEKNGMRLSPNSEQLQFEIATFVSNNPLLKIKPIKKKENETAKQYFIW